MMKKRILMVIWMLAVPLVMIAAGVKAEAATSGDWEYEVLEDGTVNITDYLGNDTEITLPQTIDGKAVTMIVDSAFSGDKTIVSVTIPEGVVRLGEYCFDGCSNLQKVDLPSTLTSLGGIWTFKNCSSLTDIEIPEKITSLGYQVFDGCENLSEIKVNANNPVLYEENGIVYNREEKSLECCPGGASGSVTVAEGIEQIDAYAFSGCEKITNITLPNSLKIMEEAVFVSCTGLEKIIIPEGTTTLSDWTFNGCHNLKEVTIPGSVTHIGDNQFSGCPVNLIVYGYKGTEAERCVQYENNSYDRNIQFKEINSDIGDDNITPVPLPEQNAGQNPTGNKGTASVGTPAPAAPVKASSLRITGLSNKIAAGKKVQLTVTFAPANTANKGVIWTSSNPKVATVNQNGVVSFKKKAAGKSVIITATATDGSGAKAVFKVKSMKGVVKKVTITGAKNRTVKAGKALKLKAKVAATKGANKKLKWTSSNTKYATVSASGKVKTKKAGKGKKVKITAMATDGSGKKQVVKVRMK